MSSVSLEIITIAHIEKLFDDLTPSSIAHHHDIIKSVVNFTKWSHFDFMVDPWDI